MELLEELLRLFNFKQTLNMQWKSSEASQNTLNLHELKPTYSKRSNKNLILSPIKIFGSFEWSKISAIKDEHEQKANLKNITA